MVAMGDLNAKLGGYYGNDEDAPVNGAIRGGAHRANTRGVAIRGGRDGPTLSADEDAPVRDTSTTVYTGTTAAFRATAAKMELARADLTGDAYRGDLRRFAGMPRRFATCWLIASDTSPLITHMNAVITQLQTRAYTHRRIETPLHPMCLLYPATLTAAINELVDALKLRTVAHIDAFETAHVVPTGDFGTDLHVIADDIVAMVPFVSDLEHYHLVAAQKISEILHAI